MDHAVKAIVFAGAALILLLPTFNALNGSHLEAVEPPFTIKPPKPPQNPPEGDDTEIPPPDEGEMPLPADCPPPKDEVRYSERFGGSTAGQSDDAVIRVPPYTLGMGIRITYQQFKGNFELDLSDPEGETRFQEEATFFELAPPRSDTRDGMIDAPEPGDWPLTWEASLVAMGGGSVDVVLRLACGGMFDE